MLKRAHSLIELKAIDDEERVIEGIATTPTPDRVGDVVEPDGAEFKLPIPLLWQHDSGNPVGWVEAASIGANGITIRARFAKIAEPGPLKDSVDRAWQSVKSGLVRGLSIGFKGLEEARIDQTWSYRYLKWLWLELSCVTIPANGEATITAVKAADMQQRAATGHVVYLKDQPGASGSTRKHIPKGPDMKLTEQIAALEAKRAASVARREEIQSKAVDAGRTKDAAEKEEFDTLSNEIETIDAELVDLKRMEADALKGAKTVAGKSPAEGAASRSGSAVELKGNVVRVEANVEKGIGLARFAMALIRAKGHKSTRSRSSATRSAGWTSSPSLDVMKAAVAAGDTTTSGWASELVYNQNLASEFIEFLRPMTIVGKLDGLRRVPFNVRIPEQQRRRHGLLGRPGLADPGVEGHHDEVAGHREVRGPGRSTRSSLAARARRPNCWCVTTSRKPSRRSWTCSSWTRTWRPWRTSRPRRSPTASRRRAPTGTAATNLRTDIATLMTGWRARRSTPRRACGSCRRRRRSRSRSCSTRSACRCTRAST
jgi:HK97 family phage prohead protease